MNKERKITSIWDAAEFGTLPEFLSFYKKDFLQEQNAKELGGQGLLHFAVKGQNLEIIKFLINEGIFLNQRDDYERTPMHYISSTRSSDLNEKILAIATYLLDSGSDVFALDIYGNNPLWYACHFSHITKVNYAMVSELLKYKPDINHKNKANRSPLDLARDRGYTDLEELLLKSKK